LFFVLSKRSLDGWESQRGEGAKEGGNGEKKEKEMTTAPRKPKPKPIRSRTNLKGSD